MRNSARIGPFMRQLEILWQENPDQRFGQLVMNLSRNQDGSFPDTWNWEEDEWRSRMEKASNNDWPGHQAQRILYGKLIGIAWPLRYDPTVRANIRTLLGAARADAK